MTKSDFIDAVATKSNLSKKDAGAAVDAVLDSVKDALSRGDDVVFTGFVNQSELPALYGASDVFVLPSEHEPWGLAVNEAMCASLPVVVSREVGCVGDLVRDRHLGRVGDEDEGDPRASRVAQGQRARPGVGQRQPHPVRRNCPPRDPYLGGDVRAPGCGGPAGDREGEHDRQQMQRRVHSHQPIAPVPVELERDLVARCERG